MSLKIVDGKDSKNSILLLKKNCIPLELIVNKFVDKDSWKPIGDHLFYYVRTDSRYPKSDTLIVNTYQFLKLKEIIVDKNFN